MKRWEEEMHKLEEEEQQIAQRYAHARILLPICCRCGLL